jgi:hypothetical protein
MIVVSYDSGNNKALFRGCRFIEEGSAVKSRLIVTDTRVAISQ